MKLLAGIILATCTTFSTLSIAHNAMAANSATKRSSHFEAHITGDINAALQTPISIKVKLSEDLQYRAEHLSKKLKDRSLSRGLNNGFSGNGFYGKKALANLAKRLERRTTKRLEKAGIDVNENAPTVLELTLIDAKPNRPTFRQMSKNASLSHRSFGIGGAKFEAKLIAPSGDLANFKYKWYENNILDARYNGTWTDANRAIDRFARKLSKALSK